MQIRPSTVDELLAKGQALFAAHYAEVSDAEDPPLAINADLYRGIEAAGMLLVLGLFEGDELHGYCVATLTPHQLVDGSICTASALFVSPAARRQSSGRWLMDSIEAMAKNRGATDVYWHARHGMRFDLILRRRGCRELETIYTRKL